MMVGAAVSLTVRPHTMECSCVTAAEHTEAEYKPITSSLTFSLRKDDVVDWEASLLAGESGLARGKGRRLS